MIQQKKYEFNMTIINTNSQNDHIYSYIQLPFHNVKNKFRKKKILLTKIMFDNQYLLPYFLIHNRIEKQSQRKFNNVVPIIRQYAIEPQAVKMPKTLLKIIFADYLLKQWKKLSTNIKELLLSFCIAKIKIKHIFNINFMVNFFKSITFTRELRIK